MKRYAALVRGVMPTKPSMPDLARAFERAGCKEVRTVLGSGNVVFSAEATPTPALEKKLEAALEKHLGRKFPTMIRSVDALKKLLAADPYAAFKLPPGSKRVITFLRGRPKAAVKLPADLGSARIHAQQGTEVFTSYVRGASSPEFMVLIERAFGKDQTTRTWETIEKIVKAAG